MVSVRSCLTGAYANALKFIILLAAAVMIGTALLALAYAFPGDALRMAAKDAPYIFENNGSMHTFVPASVTTKVDNQTDAMLLNLTVADVSGSAPEAALRSRNESER